jgi:purine-nucleoside phosphorylase
MENRLQQIEEGVRYIQEKIQQKPDIGLILGSGLGVLADEIESPVAIDFHDIPHFPPSTVPGHAGRLVAGTLGGKSVLVMQGRIHYYEGYTMSQVVFPVYVMKGLGISSLIVTNACGGINRGFQPGDLMAIQDHLNLTGDHPLIGPNLEIFGPRFPDMSRAYDPQYRELAKKKAAELGFTLQEGVYAGISGPSFMTPTELMMLARVGADAVGMSTVPEVIAGVHAGMRILGISCVTDRAVGEELEPLSHEQVMEMAHQARPRFISLIKGILPEVN